MQRCLVLIKDINMYYKYDIEEAITYINQNINVLIENKEGIYEVKGELKEIINKFVDLL